MQATVFIYNMESGVRFVIQVVERKEHFYLSEHSILEQFVVKIGCHWHFLEIESAAIL